MSGPEPAEVIAGRAMLADFQRMAREYAAGTIVQADWLSWSMRLSQHMQSLLDALGRAEPAAPAAAQGGTYTAPDGSAWLARSPDHPPSLAAEHRRRYRHHRTAGTGMP